MMTFFSAIWTYLLPLPIFIYIMRKTEAKTLEKHKMTVKTFVICISITMFLMWIGNVMGVIITSGIGSLIQHEVANPINDVINNSGLVANLIIITTIAPIFEELIFRKLLIDRTIKYGGTTRIGYTIKNFIDSNKFPGMKLISDNSGINREIRGVRIIVAPNMENFLGGVSCS